MPGVQNSPTFPRLGAREFGLQSPIGRARAIQGRMERKTVHFPDFASWWPQARQELINFPNAAHKARAMKEKRVSAGGF